MKISIQLNEKTITVDDDSINLSIPLDFHGPQPNAYGVQPASVEACKAGDLIGDTRRGGSCNFEQYTFIPHCNGTHTECVGHVTNARISVIDCLTDVFMPATLASVAPVLPAATDETYAVALDESDLLITRSILAASGILENSAALIIRTLPNDEDKRTKQYLNEVPAFFSTEAMEYIVELGVRHLLVDLPSIDRLYDQGRLSNHRIFWGIEQGSFELSDAARPNNTVTEFIYVPNAVADGDYLLNLQIAPFVADASPSRPVLFPMTSQP